MAELYRLGIAPETKKKIVGDIDNKRFLELQNEDRSVLYSFAVTLAAKLKLPPKPGKFESFVMDKSVKDQEMATMLLSFFLTRKNPDKDIDKVGLKQRKELVSEELNPMANAGFDVMKELLMKPEDIVIADFIKEMDESYADACEAFRDLGLPPAKPFSPLGGR